MDSKKAFDSLCVAFESCGILAPPNVYPGMDRTPLPPPPMNRKQRVTVCKSHSESATVVSGVRQGIRLSPFLFTVLLDDLPECLQSACGMFLDETKLCKNYNLQKITFSRQP